MLFTTIEFLCLFLPVTVAGFALADRFVSPKAARLWLVAASFFFYAYWDISLLPLLLASIVVNFLCGHALFRQRSKPLLIAGIVFNVGLLGYFKYAGFFIENIEHLLNVKIAALQIVLPLAISFFTFQQVAYLADVYQGKAVEPDFLNYCLFVSFFPQLVSGPIVHHSEMMPQFRDAGSNWLTRSLTPVAFGFLVIGLYKKVVLADGIAPIADRVFDAAAKGVPALGDAWIGALAYTFQIYFDFSGYSDMAIGVALLFGIRLPLNFNSPYKATSIIDFWRGWHMTLSRFIRDYIYIPLGGNRKGKSRRYTNLMLAMLIGGLWHGAGWTFVIWGGLHGLYLIVNHGWSRIFPVGSAGGWLRSRIGWVLTFLSVVIAWVFFRADDVGAAARMLQGMSALAPGQPVLSGGRELFWLAVMGFIVWFLPNTWQLFRHANPVVLPSAELAKSDLFPLPAAVPNFGPAVLFPLSVAFAVVSLLVVIDRGNQTQRFIYMIF